jgi:hypothetical protein
MSLREVTPPSGDSIEGGGAGEQELQPSLLLVAVVALQLQRRFSLRRRLVAATLAPPEVDEMEVTIKLGIHCCGCEQSTDGGVGGDGDGSSDGSGDSSCVGSLVSPREASSLDSSPAFILLSPLS